MYIDGYILGQSGILKDAVSFVPLCCDLSATDREARSSWGMTGSYRQLWRYLGASLMAFSRRSLANSGLILQRKADHCWLDLEVYVICITYHTTGSHVAILDSIAAGRGSMTPRLAKGELVGS